jgi:hypothetical protein
LAAAVLARARAAGAPGIALTIVAGHGLLATLRAAAGTPLEGRLVPHLMLLLLDLGGLLRAALPAFQERLAVQPWLHGLRGTFGLQVAGQYARLAVAGGQVSADDGAASRVLRLDQGLFWRLFLGLSPVALLAGELAAVAGARCTGEEMALLGALFPPQDFVYWAPDHA